MFLYRKVGVVYETLQTSVNSKLLAISFTAWMAGTVVLFYVSLYISVKHKLVAASLAAWRGVRCGLVGGGGGGSAAVHRQVWGGTWCMVQE